MPENHDVSPRGAEPASPSAVRDELIEPAGERRHRAELGSVTPFWPPFSAHARRLVRPQLSKWVNRDESPSGDRELLGHVIALKAGTNYESLVVERICRPLKMDSTQI